MKSYSKKHSKSYKQKSYKQKSCKQKSCKQKIYKMKGCSSSKTRKYHLNGGGATSLGNLENINANNLAIPAKNITFLPNPALAYTGKGGNNLSCRGDTNVNGESTRDVLAFTGTKSPISNAYPTTGPPPSANNWLGSQLKGGCNCGQNYSVQAGGGSRLNHRPECKCSNCKQKIIKGGNGLPFGQGLPNMKGPLYPDGLVGSPWRPPVADWPGVNGISGDRNHLAYNTYTPVDISRQMIDTGANPPFSIGGGSKKRSYMNKRSKKGGLASNMLSQDLINLGRQFQFNVGSTYNALNGYAAPVSPLPWKDQIPSANQKYNTF